MRQVKRAITAKQRENALGGKAGKKGEITRAPVKATARVKTVLLPPI
jgi:UV DNA damage endonuclease